VMTYATKMEETDAWFEDKTNMVNSLNFNTFKSCLSRPIAALDSVVDPDQKLFGLFRCRIIHPDPTPDPYPIFLTYKFILFMQFYS
jgi:hypothetical protein